ncbi:MAG: LLM class F420-dependent oxidoreductase [Caldilineaceae bacterium]
MRIGIVYPQTEYPTDRAALRDFAHAARDLGFTHILAYDHVLGANPNRPDGWKGPYTYRESFHEPLVLFAYLAAVLDEMEFVTGVIVLPQRQTALVAKQAATLDLLCNGRLRVGVGIGWNEVEYQALGSDFATRGRRSEEQAALLRRLWSEELVTFNGTWHNVPDAGINPLPIQRPIPLWFGGHAEAIYARIARYGDGWLPNYPTAAEAAPALDALDRALEAEGRTRAQIGIEPRLLYGEGKPEVWGPLLEGWRAAGATHITLNTMRSGLRGADAHLAAMERFSHSMMRGK